MNKQGKQGRGEHRATAAGPGNRPENGPENGPVNRPDKGGSEIDAQVDGHTHTHANTHGNPWRTGQEEHAHTKPGHVHSLAGGGCAHAHHHGHHHGRHDSTPDHHHAHEKDGGSQGRILTVRATAGLSGDMMLAGLAGLAGLGDVELEALVDELKLPALHGCLAVEPRSVNHIAGFGCRITLPHEHAHRNLADIRQIIAASAMPDTAKQLSIKAFTILAKAEGAVHGKSSDQVSFHEVGALDSILDTCMVCRIFSILAPSRFVCSPLPLADGMIDCAHGLVPSPAPAVLHMLENVPVCGFSGQGETVTPTALSLLKALNAEFGPWPRMTVSKTAIAYGGKVFLDAPNGALWAIGDSEA